MTSQTTWKPYPRLLFHGQLSQTDHKTLPSTSFAFPNCRKEPMTDASHVRNALARFDQVKDVTDAERDIAFSNIQEAAKHFDVQMEATDWRQLGK